jgi:hypothetical protein
MRAKRFLPFILILFLTNYSYANTIDSLLVKLDEAISRGTEYQQIREKRIEGLESLIDEAKMYEEQKYFVYSKLYDEYRAFKFDSAIYYLEIKTNLAQKLNKENLLKETQLQKIGLFSATGMYKEAIDVVEQVNPLELNNEQLVTYYSILSKLYSQLSKYTRVPSQKPEYRRLQAAYQDSCMSLLPTNSKQYLEQLEQKYYLEKQFDKSTEVAFQLINTTSPDEDIYALYAYLVAINMGDQENHEAEKEYLIKSALTDIRNGIKDNASLTMLAMIMYRENKIDKAYNYIHYSLSDAEFFDAPLRIIELSAVLPVIIEGYNKKLEKQKNKLQNYILLISFLTVFLFLSLFFINKQYNHLKLVRSDIQSGNSKLNELNNELSVANQKLKGLNNKLVESNHIKEQYIGHFLNRCSNYIEKLENYQKYVNKKLAARNFNELYESTKSNQLIDEELTEFYQTFDKTFLILFPNFVEQLNELFNEDERIVLKKDELLNTELRIFALIRLGINDSSKIASLLRYSVNTIYNYRVKIKNKSIVPREEFEEMVKNIGTFNSNTTK